MKVYFVAYASAAIGLITGLFFGFEFGENNIKNKAIKAEAAQYIVDKNTGVVTFEFIKP